MPGLHEHLKSTASAIWYKKTVKVRKWHNKMKNTALSAMKEKIIFKNESHREFYNDWIQKCRYQDVYHQALVYCLGISEDTGTMFISAKVIRMAFNLYCNNAPSVDYYQKHEDQLTEYQQYTAEDLFCSGYVGYFWQAIKIRYPEFCFYEDWEDLYAKD
jgi:hypothetical protein